VNLTMSDPKPKVTRFEIQKAMAADVEAAIAKVETQLGLDPTDTDAQRRIFRALVTIASQRLFDLGAPPPLIATQAFEAVRAEHKYRHEKKTIDLSQPFGPPTPAKA
jgi:hypothetical protein